MKNREPEALGWHAMGQQPTSPSRAIQQVLGDVAPPPLEKEDIHAHLVAELFASRPELALRLCNEIEHRFGWKYRYTIMTKAGLIAAPVSPETGAAIMTLL